MLRLRFARSLAAPPAAAWTLLAVPAQMSRWSTARVESVALGDGAHPAGVGAVRRVHVPRPGRSLVEVVEAVDAPHRIEYRVIAGAPIVHHRGAIEIGARGDLEWTVEIEAVSRALEPVMRRMLVPQMERSLDRLVEVARTAVPVDLPPPRALDVDADLAQLRRDAAAIAAHQADLAAELDGRGDPRAHFARVYRYVTEGLVAATEANRFAHPAWVLRLVPIFDAYFTDALFAAQPEPHWARAFAHIRSVAARPRFEVAMHAVYAGMRAHIEEDLPRTLARTYARHYAGACDHVRFYADYLRMAPVFTGAGDRLMADLPRREWTPRARLVDRLTPRALRDRIIDRHFYPITRERRRAFERATLLAPLISKI